MSILIGYDFLKKLSLVHDRLAVEIKGVEKKPIINNPREVYRGVERIFELRHIYCHELVVSRSEKINKDEIANCFKSGRIFLEAADEVFWNLIAPDRPLTQSDMNIKADEIFRKATEEMNEICSQIFLKIDQERKKEFDKTHNSWKNFRDSYATFKADAYKGGTIQPFIYAIAAESVTKTRIEQLKEYLEEFNKYEDAS